VREYFHREEMFEVTPLETLLRQMDDAGVERAILTIDPTTRHRSRRFAAPSLTASS
jgi:hypothetical protein